MPRLAVTVLMLALLAATTTAFALTEVLKLEGSPIARPKFDVTFSPVCDCRRDTARLPIRLRKEETVDAVIVDDEGDSVRALAGEPGPTRGRVVFRWDGRGEGGAVVPDGSYRLRLTFEEAGRTIVLPNEIRVDTKPPTLGLVSVSPSQVVPEEESLRIAVRSNEAARLLLFANGKRVARGTFQEPSILRLIWGGTSHGKALTPGNYTLTVEAQDLAGNVSAATPGGTVEIVRPGE